MADSVLFIGWGPNVPGREQQALQVFNEAVEYWGKLQQQGDITSFEPVALEPHGGDLAGFALLRGERAKLNALRTSEEFLRLTTRDILVVHNVGIVNGFIGDELNQLFADQQQQAAELAP